MKLPPQLDPYDLNEWPSDDEIEAASLQEMGEDHSAQGGFMHGVAWIKSLIEARRGKK